ncbi:hypothetical protein OSB04_001460 [Centaurea solstitialis]|uniref:Uncharacterized protein n=1 Tax=Centaurea solstitialis TaxID=347529 RepID=A0AA38TSU7_9ASTR|nr:hypothetical protein OSB04_001460 [Centaurea solstitialis]
MMFSRLVGRTRRNVFNGGRLTGSSVYMGQADDTYNQLGFLRCYLAATNNNEKHGSSKLMYVSDINLLLPNLECSQDDDDKEKKETPKGNNQESKSQGWLVSYFDFLFRNNEESKSESFFSDDDKEKKETPRGNNQKSESKG